MCTIFVQQLAVLNRGPVRKIMFFHSAVPLAPFRFFGFCFLNLTGSKTEV